MSELFVVRHGQASFGAENYDQISALGLQQSVWLGEYFKARNTNFSQLWLGDLLRHQQTAQGILRGLASPLEQTVVPELNEFNFQTVVRAYLNVQPHDALPQNPVPADFYRLLKKAMLAWSQGHLAAQDLSESWQAFYDRVALVLSRVRQTESDKPVLLVTSGGVIAMMMSIVLGLDAKQVVELNLQIRNSSVSHFYFNQHSIRLSGFNHVSHLDSVERFNAITFS